MVEHIKEQRKKSIWLWIGIGSILIVGLFFRFYNIDKKVYWGDEVATSLWISGHTPTELQKHLSDRIVNIEDLKRFQYPNPDRGLYFTIKSLSIENPHHPPLYYGLVRIWVETFGDSVWSVRSLSAFASILIFPFFFWLCRELFESKWVALMAVVILAFSPVNVLLAQEARQYSLWTLTILLSSVTLLRALYSKKIFPWVLYALTVCLGIYTHTLFFLVVVAHGVYIFGINLSDLNLKPVRIPRELLYYLVATLVGLAAFTPWAYLIIANFSTVQFKLSWVNYKIGILYLIGQWGFNFSSVFFDAGYAFKYVKDFDFKVLLSYSARVLMLILTAYSIYFLCLSAKNRTRLFILSLILVPFLLLAIPDLILGGTRSGNGYRFLMPSYLGVLIAVSFLLATKIENSKKRFQWFALTALVIICGVVSCAISSQAEIWWTKPNDYWTPQITRKINEAHNPLLIVDLSSAKHLLRFSHRLHPNAGLLAVGKPDQLNIPDGFTEVFIVDPSPSLQKRLEEIEGFSLESIESFSLGKFKNLWKFKNIQN